MKRIFKNKKSGSGSGSGTGTGTGTGSNTGSGSRSGSGSGSGPSSNIDINPNTSTSASASANTNTNTNITNVTNVTNTGDPNAADSNTDPQMSQQESQPNLQPQHTSSSDEERDLVSSLREEPSYKSSVFSPHRTFDSYSTHPTTTNASSSHQKGGGQTSTRSPFDGDEEDLAQEAGSFLSNIDKVGKPLRAMSADRYDSLTRSTSNLSVGGSGSSRKGSHSGAGEFSAYITRKNSDSGVVGGSMSLSSMAGGAGSGGAGGGGAGGAGSSSDNRDTVTLERVEREITLLYDRLLDLTDRYNQNQINTSKSTITLVELLDTTLNFGCYDGNGLSLENNEPLRNILKVVLQFHDVYLRFEVYENSRNLMVRSLKEFLNRLGFNLNLNPFGTIPFFKNFSISHDCPLPNKDKLETILQKIIDSNTSLISDQEGAFIAPTLRGLTKHSAILSIQFGFPDPQSDHYDILKALYQTFPDIHFYIAKNYIKPCSSRASTPAASQKPYRFTPPFRIPNKLSPEVSISISAENGIKSSGTLGCYLTPNFTSKTEKSLLKYKGASFALTCAHVLLCEDQDYPIATIPSNVLMNAYKSALSDERDKYLKESIEYKSYDLELKNCDEEYSLKLGQVMWGERVLIKNKISDIAIVKLGESLKISDNYLGDDPAIPISLKFKNSIIKRIIPISQFKNHSKVFKIGSKTSYTTGEINSIRLVYWLEGHLQTSEFVISSPEPMFANGGDSGSLILNDLPNELGLGAIGMLHSYDGELKQFGLFSPMEDILARLKEVTGLEWGFI